MSDIQLATRAFGVLSIREVQDKLDSIEKLQKENKTLIRSIKSIHDKLSMGEHLDGEWIKEIIHQEVFNPVIDAHVKMYNKYKKEIVKLQKEKAELVELLKNTIKSAEFFMSYADCNRDTWTCRCSFCKDTENSRYLNDARNYFKEKE